MSARIFATVGTDHHPFDRLLDWLEPWAAKHPDVSLVVQHGHSRPAASGENHQMLGSAELAQRYQEADLIVAQVGPGTIADANAAGLLPVVVPRDPALGEVVDGHQFAFGRFMAEKGRCLTVTTAAELHRTLDALLADPTKARLTAEPEQTPASAAVAELAAALLRPGQPRRKILSRLLEMAGKV